MSPTPTHMSPERLHDLRDAALTEIVAAVQHASEAVVLLQRVDAQIAELQHETTLARRQRVAAEAGALKR